MAKYTQKEKRAFLEGLELAVEISANPSLSDVLDKYRHHWKMYKKCPTCGKVQK